MCNLGLQELVTLLQHVKHHSHIDVCKEHVLVTKHFNKLIQFNRRVQYLQKEKPF